MNERAQSGIVHGRFQPPHNGHIRYILAALERSKHLFIGICTPEICTAEEAAESGYPCTAEENPYSFHERSRMIALVLSESGISARRYSFLQFPSDYAGVATLVPDGTVFFLSKTSDTDTQKSEYLQSLGLKTEVVIELPFSEWRERSGDVRDGILAGTDDWKKLVPQQIVPFLEQRGAA